MRADTDSFRGKNLAPAKDPRYVVEVAFDSANTILWYFTSHTDAATPSGASVISNVVEGLSGTSQSLNPDEARATIGTISFSIVDKSSTVTSQLGTQLTLGRSTRQQRVRVYVGYDGLAWADYTLIQTQLVEDITYKDGLYTFRCADIQRAMRKDIFEAALTNITANVGLADTTINAVSTSAFSMVAHGTSYSDAPSSTVGYIKIENEVIRYTGKTATTFTGCTRGALNTLAAEHKYDASVSSDRQLKVDEYIYLEMPAVKLAYALLTGVLHNQSGATLPTKWHLGISTAYVRLANFTGIGNDLWNAADDQQGFIARFEGLEKTDGKAFIEKELYLLLGCFSPVYADGAVGIKRMSAVLAGSAYVVRLDEANVVSYSELTDDFKSLHNKIQIDWNYVPEKKRNTRTTLLIDSESTAIHGDADVYKVKFRGLYGGRHASNVLESRFAAFRDRYTGPPLRLSVQVLPSLNYLEVGDIVRVDLDCIRDFIVNGTLDRSFEIQSIAIDWITGNVNLTLFASSRAAAPPATISGAVALNDAFYTAAGTALSSVLTITGSNPGHISANGNLAGNADLTASGAIYYYDGDLVLDSGVTVTFNNNVQLRVKGHLQINGTFDGKGRGLAGAVAPTPVNVDDVYAQHSLHTDGTAGFIGNTESGGGFVVTLDRERVTSFPGQDQGFSVIGKNPVLPAIDLRSTGGAISGLPTDLRGTSGSSGHVIYDPLPTEAPTTYYGAGGNGGNGGAGILIISRGATFGASGKVDTSGGNGSVGGTLTITFHNYTGNAGAGAGGAPGACLFVLDGQSVTSPSISAASNVALYGLTPITGEPGYVEDIVEPFETNQYSPYVGTGDGTTFPLPDMSGNLGAHRIIYLAANSTASADADSIVLPGPTALTLESGTNALLKNGDGTIVTRIKITWTPATDARILAYDVQFKPSADSLWSGSQTIFGSTSALAYAVPVIDGVSYDVRIRSAGDIRTVSAWSTITGHVVIGKTEPPSNVSGFSAQQNGSLVTFRWNRPADLDFSGTIIRYMAAPFVWDNALPVTEDTKGNLVTNHAVPPGNWVVGAKHSDTSKNLSLTAATFAIEVTNEFDIVSVKDQAALGWPGTRTNFVKHDVSNTLVPDSQTLASAMTDVQLWDTFVYNPYVTCAYEAPELDMAFDTNVRVWSERSASLGPGATGTSDPYYEIDYRLAAGAYDGFERWTVGTASFRYLKSKAIIDTSTGVAYLSGFTVTADVEEYTLTGTNIAISVGGTAVTFTPRYHLAPSFQATAQAVAGAARYATYESLSATGTTIRVFNGSGTEVGGTVSWQSTGA